MAGIWLSNTKQHPYLPITYLENDLTISQTRDADSVDLIGLLYIIADRVSFPEIRLQVEGETALGTSLLISTLDIMGVPLHWGKLIKLTDIDTPTSIQTIPIKYKWTAINNIYLLKKLKANGFINIYEV